MQPVVASHAATYRTIQGTLDLMPKRLRDLAYSTSGHIFRSVEFPYMLWTAMGEWLGGSTCARTAGIIRQGIERSGFAFRIGLALGML